mgnify:FL=1
MSRYVNEDMGFDMEHLDLAVRNSYDVIINKKDIIDFIENEEGYFIHMPSEGATIEVLDDMEEYFSGIEEYEKCAKIVKYKQEGFE